jgi:DNA repair exonuclease SbcCD ATPase subunit
MDDQANGTGFHPFKATDENPLNYLKKLFDKVSNIEDNMKVQERNQSANNTEMKTIIESLKDAIEQNSQVVTQLKNQISKNVKDVTEIKSRLDEHGDKFGKLETENTELKKQISELFSKFQELDKFKTEDQSSSTCNSPPKSESDMSLTLTSNPNGTIELQAPP